MSATIGVKEAADRTGVTYRQLDHWINAGLIEELSGVKGSGHPRAISVDDLERIAVMGRVSRALRQGGERYAVPQSILAMVAWASGTTPAADTRVHLGEGVWLSWNG